MKIGIDIDDTILFTAESMFKYADIYKNEIPKTQINVDCLGFIRDGYYINAYYGWDHKTTISFFNKYYKKILNECTMLPEVDDIIRKLKSDGHSIHFVTARLMNIDGCDTENITKKSLEKYKIPYDSLNLQVHDKLYFFKRNNLDLCIEDNYEMCRQMTDNGIKSLLMTTKMNSNVPSNDIIRVNNWHEIYVEIEKLKRVERYRLLL